MILICFSFVMARISAKLPLKVARMVGEMRFEMIPSITTSNQALKDLLELKSSLSVTCSPKNGIKATFDLCERLLDLGFQNVMPHISGD